MAQQPLVGQGLLIIQISRSHSDTPQSEGLLWMRDQPDADLHLTTRNTRNSQISMSPAGFEPRILGCRRPQTHALHCAATWIGSSFLMNINFRLIFFHTQ
jgi:hypothetical protein